MLNNCQKFSGYTDEELVEIFLKDTDKTEIIEYFIDKRCTKMLKFIAGQILGDCDYHEILGEFYMFLQEKDWHVLRLYKNKNGAKLGTYLAHCTTNFFLKKKEEQQKMQERNISLDSHSTLSEVSQLEVYDDNCIESEEHRKYMYLALEKLDEGDRTLIDLLILKGHRSMDIVDQVWKYIESKEEDWRKLPVKRVQDSIAMKKHRASLRLIYETRLIAQQMIN